MKRKRSHIGDEYRRSGASIAFRRAAKSGPHATLPIFSPEQRFCGRLFFTPANGASPQISVRFFLLCRGVKAPRSSKDAVGADPKGSELTRSTVGRTSAPTKMKESYPRARAYGSLLPAPSRRRFLCVTYISTFRCIPCRCSLKKMSQHLCLKVKISSLNPSLLILI